MWWFIIIFLFIFFWYFDKENNENDTIVNVFKALLAAMLIYFLIDVFICLICIMFGFGIFSILF